MIIILACHKFRSHKIKFIPLNTLKVKNLGYGKIRKVLLESIKKTQMIHRKKTNEQSIQRIIKKINSNRCHLFVPKRQTKNTTLIISNASTNVRKIIL